MKNLSFDFDGGYYEFHDDLMPHGIYITCEKCGMGFVVAEIKDPYSENPLILCSKPIGMNTISKVIEVWRNR